MKSTNLLGLQLKYFIFDRLTEIYLPNNIKLEYLKHTFNETTDGEP